MRPLRAFHSAVAMYTWLPVRKHDWVDRDFPDGLVALPWLGVVLGAAAGLLGWGSAAASGSWFLGALMAVGAVAYATGAMHLDGIADVADALGSRKPAEQARAIMKQSDIGPMGVASLLVVLLLEVASLGVAPPGTWPLLMALGMAAGRVVPLAATLPGRGEEPVPGTLSSLVAGKVGEAGLWASRGAVLVTGGAVTWWLLGWLAAACWSGVVVAAWVFATCWQRHLVRRLGRLNGDCYGSLIELTQLAVWLGIALTVKLIGVA